jgi:hypothetical protein
MKDNPMSNDLVTAEKSNLPAASDSNCEELAAEAANDLGTLLKFAKGVWSLGEDKAPAGAEFIAAPEAVVIGWVRFDNQRVAERILKRPGDKRRLPDRDELSMADKSEWPLDTKGAPKDPWVRQHYLPLIDGDGVRQKAGLGAFKPNGNGRRKSMSADELIARVTQVAGGALDKPADKPKLGKVVATYDYTDANGELLYQVLRLEPKSFRQRRTDLQRGYCYALTARTGVGKTALALAFAAHVGLGLALGDRDVDKGRVLMFAGENPNDVQARWIAMSQQMDFDLETIDVHFVPGRFKISELIERIRKEMEALGGAALLIVDTSAAYFEGDDENDNVQLGAHASRMRELRIPGGPCTIINCHPTKNAADDNLIPRGGGAFLNEVDGNLCAKKDDLAVELHWQGKFRGPEFPPINFMLKSVTHERLKDSKGRLISTVVASYLTDQTQQAMAKAARSDEDLLLEAIGKDGSASISDWAINLGWLSSKGGALKSRVHRVLGRLKKFKFVAEERGKYSLTDKGQKALEGAKK